MIDRRAGLSLIEVLMMTAVGLVLLAVAFSGFATIHRQAHRLDTVHDRERALDSVYRILRHHLVGLSAVRSSGRIPEGPEVITVESFATSRSTAYHRTLHLEFLSSPTGSPGPPADLWFDPITSGLYRDDRRLATLPLTAMTFRFLEDGGAPRVEVNLEFEDPRGPRSGRIEIPCGLPRSRFPWAGG